MPEVIDLTLLTDSSDESEVDEEESDSGTMESSQYAEEPLDGPHREQLHVAIGAVPELRLRELVTRLCDHVPTVERAFFKELVVVRELEDEVAEEVKKYGNRKRVREVAPLWEPCANCEEEFDTNEEREEGECEFHPGDLEVDEASFVDWDEDCHGPMDTPSNRRSFPENFTWSCCEADGTTAGCVRGEHIPQGGRKKRRIS
ncbi:hypothetical protein JAAARDRAFT_651962 [Jaapia argillacea MUCL 33604]|uniref:C2H2-type domain-containing protein n=1 Tax=Jaapia argillacea MUCL 33604 TaxID=933084 RepID=A0A067PW82_9AGAM|nr:hypothetical protein JAAARDRAFT_651962 [Jaapia argillacea MUCL 33604]